MSFETVVIACTRINYNRQSAECFPTATASSILQSNSVSLFSIRPVMNAAEKINKNPIMNIGNKENNALTKKQATPRKKTICKTQNFFPRLLYESQFSCFPIKANDEQGIRNQPVVTLMIPAKVKKPKMKQTTDDPYKIFLYNSIAFTQYNKLSYYQYTNNIIIFSWAQ